MRTTIRIDDDVLEQARSIAAQRQISFKAVINEALRAGLKEVEKPALQRPYQTEAHPMGLRQGRSLDNIQELLAQIEGEDAR
ncbi:MAG: type II toxin-antitoxin system VapB family antitoxin [Desulfovermiculus sp.]